MRTFLVVAALAVLSSEAPPVRARAALAADPAEDPAEQCVCQSADPGRALQLIRGDDQLSRCQKGDYCDCAAKTVANCDFTFMDQVMRFNEAEQMCDFDFDCQAFFDQPTESPATAEPTPPSEPADTTAAAPTSPPEPCTCANATDTSRPGQLIRGPDEVPRCQKGDYCDCRAGTVQRCADFQVLGERWRFNERDQECDLTFDCQAFFSGPTERPSTGRPRTPAPTAPATAAAPTSPPEPCVCSDPADASRPQQLVRGALGGDSELALCQRGDYCDCKSKRLQHCDAFLGEAARFNEDLQMCDFTFDCESFLRVTVTVGPTSRTSSTAGGWAPSSGGSARMALSATLFSLTAALTVFNLLLLYRRACWPQRGRAGRAAHRRHQAVPALYSPEFANCTRKAPLESAA